MKEKVSIIICAYNEEETIEEVVRKCHEYNSKSEIIVVDDGSSDKTQDILSNLNKEIDFKNIRLPENKGKSNAMVVGVENAENEVILFWDADVTGIRKEHFDQILKPVLDENAEADMVLGSPSETLIDYRVNPFKSLTGERALYKKDLEPILENIRDIRFGVETYINLYFQAHGKKVKYTLLDGLTHPTKYGKTSPAKATKEFISEGQEIAVTLLKNYDLITKTIGNSFEEQGEKFKDSIKKMQDDLNDKIQTLLRNNG
ncbi:MAG: glycosyltransferase family 2 protein [Bacteroidetes bacterium]|nr:glycosyltransferase family 2 protein [Bacteroidota bacterium]